MKYSYCRYKASIKEFDNQAFQFWKRQFHLLLEVTVAIYVGEFIDKSKTCKSPAASSKVNYT